MTYIHQLADWPHMNWDNQELATLLAKTRNQQGWLLGRMAGLGFSLKLEASVESMTLEVVKSTEIEGEQLDPEQVRSSIARKLGVDLPGLIESERHVDGVVDMMLDATLHFAKPLTRDRLFGWHAALFPTGFSGAHKITVGDWRKDDEGPMQVVSGPLGRERVHFQAPESPQVAREMDQFLEWFNRPLQPNEDAVLKSAQAHLWFVTIHPFDDGNGRMARAIAEMQMARADNSAQRYYSMSAQIRKERNEYYKILEETQQGGLDVTEWMKWFLSCLDRALVSSKELLEKVLIKSYSWQVYNKHPLNERQRKIMNMLMDEFEGKLNTSKYAKLNKCSQDLALKDINQLVDWNVLEREDAGGRSTSYKPVLYNETNWEDEEQKPQQKPKLLQKRNKVDDPRKLLLLRRK